MNIEICKMSFEHLNKLSDTLLTDFDDFWTFTTLKNELDNPNSQYFVALLNNEIVGFAGIWNVLDEMHITNIVTKKTYRHIGIASKLLEKLIETSKEKNVKFLTLEVKDTNIYAIKLYEKYNFKKVGLRKNYYGQNKNAIIMTLYF